MVVLLGVKYGHVDITDRHEALYVNKIGGQPVYPEGMDTVRCSKCGIKPLLVCQLYCPLSDGLDRFICIFVCISPASHHDEGCLHSSLQCRWQIQRWTLASVGVNDCHSRVTEPCCSSENWGDAEADDWGDSHSHKEETPVDGSCTDALSTSPSAGDTLSRLASVTITDEGTCPVSEVCRGDSERSEREFDAFYIDVYEDESRSDVEDRHIKYLLDTYCKEHPIDSGGSSHSCENVKTKTHGGKTSGKKNDNDCEFDKDEKYEKASISHNDHHFYKFSKAISPCPEQVIRYNHGGEPLLLCELPAAGEPRHSHVAPPDCESCGSRRVFELQLMPALIPNLVLTSPGCGPGGSAGRWWGEPVDAGECERVREVIEFGTVLVYTCSNNCVGASSPHVAHREYCVLQEEASAAPPHHYTRPPPVTNCAAPANVS